MLTVQQYFRLMAAVHSSAERAFVIWLPQPRYIVLATKRPSEFPAPVACRSWACSQSTAAPPLPPTAVHTALVVKQALKDTTAHSRHPGHPRAPHSPSLALHLLPRLRAPPREGRARTPRSRPPGFPGHQPGPGRRRWDQPLGEQERGRLQRPRRRTEPG